MAFELLVDIALAVGDHRHTDRPAGHQVAGLAGRLQPAQALFLGERAVLALRPVAAGAALEDGVHQPEQGTVGRIHRDRRVQLQAARIAVVAQACRILNDQNMPTLH